MGKANYFVEGEKFFRLSAKFFELTQTRRQSA